LVKKTKLEQIKTLDEICGHSVHLTELYKEKAKEFPKDSIENLYFTLTAKYFADMARGSCSLFDVATKISTTEYLPREIKIEEGKYKEFLEREPSTD